jgi:uncharacterized protein YjiK
MAFAGDMEGLQEAFKAPSKFYADMALMGATDANPVQKNVAKFALEKGSNFIFGFTHEAPKQVKIEKPGNFFSRVSMLNGPGDVPKGTFKGDTHA